MSGNNELDTHQEAAAGNVNVTFFEDNCNGGQLKDWISDVKYLLKKLAKKDNNNENFSNNDETGDFDVAKEASLLISKVNALNVLDLESHKETLLNKTIDAQNEAVVFSSKKIETQDELEGTCSKNSKDLKSNIENRNQITHKELNIKTQERKKNKIGKDLDTKITKDHSSKNVDRCKYSVPSQSSESNGDKSFFQDTDQLSSTELKGTLKLYPDIAFMFSNPAVMKDPETGKFVMIDLLQQLREQKLILRSLKETNKAARLRMYPGTTDRLRMLLIHGCKVLHFSGHGVLKNEKDYLVFEDYNGCAHLVNIPMLKKLIECGGTKIQLVFLAACNSLEIGQVFKNAGVKNVICIRREERILDEYAIIFSCAFYHALFSGATVKEAFKNGQVRVASDAEVPFNESEKYVHLERDENKSGSEKLFSTLSNGKLKDMTPKLCYRNLPAKAQQFVGRNMDMYSVIRLVQSQRLVTIRGPPGMGKTSLAKAIAHYLLKRGNFMDGVLYCAMREKVTQNSMFLSILYAINWKLKNDERLNPSEDIDFSNMVLGHLISKDVLLVFDNCEDIIHNNLNGFRFVLTKIFENCHNVHILVTSRIPIGGGIGDVPEKIYSLGPLSSYYAALLFEQHCPRALTLSELGGVKASAVKYLEKSPVLEFLGGHPQAIALAAPLLQDRSLKELEELLSIKSIDAFHEGKKDEEKLIVNTLVASLEASVEHLRQTKPECISFFCLMALLPSGALEEDFNYIWPVDDSISKSTPHWKELAHILIRYSLVIKAQVKMNSVIVDKYFTFPFITKFAEKLLMRNFGIARKFLSKCRARFASLAIKICSAISSFSVESFSYFEKLDFYDLNFWSCLKCWEFEEKVVDIPKGGISSIGRLTSAFCETLFLAHRHNDCFKASKMGISLLKSKDQLGEANVRKILGVLLYRKHKHLNSAKKHLGSALILYKSSMMGQAITLNALGCVHCKMQNFHGAKNCYMRAIPLFERLNNLYGLLSCYKWLATIHSKLPNSRNEALKYYHKSKHTQTALAKQNRSFVMSVSDENLHIKCCYREDEHIISHLQSNSKRKLLMGNSVSYSHYVLKTNKKNMLNNFTSRNKLSKERKVSSTKANFKSSIPKLDLLKLKENNNIESKTLVLDSPPSVASSSSARSRSSTDLVRIKAKNGAIGYMYGKGKETGIGFGISSKEEVLSITSDKTSILEGKLMRKSTSFTNLSEFSSTLSDDIVFGVSSSIAETEGVYHRSSDCDQFDGHLENVSILKKNVAESKGMTECMECNWDENQKTDKPSNLMENFEEVKEVEETVLIIVSSLKPTEGDLYHTTLSCKYLTKSKESYVVLSKIAKENRLKPCNECVKIDLGYSIEKSAIAMQNVGPEDETKTIERKERKGKVFVPRVAYLAMKHDQQSTSSKITSPKLRSKKALHFKDSNKTPPRKRRTSKSSKKMLKGSKQIATSIPRVAFLANRKDQTEGTDLAEKKKSKEVSPRKRSSISKIFKSNETTKSDVNTNNSLKKNKKNNVVGNRQEEGDQRRLSLNIQKNKSFKVNGGKPLRNNNAKYNTLPIDLEKSLPQEAPDFRRSFSSRSTEKMLVPPTGVVVGGRKEDIKKDEVKEKNLSEDDSTKGLKTMIDDMKIKMTESNHMENNSQNIDEVLSNLWEVMESEYSKSVKVNPLLAKAPPITAWVERNESKD